MQLEIKALLTISIALLSSCSSLHKNSELPIDVDTLLSVPLSCNTFDIDQGNNNHALLANSSSNLNTPFFKTNLPPEKQVEQQDQSIVIREIWQRSSFSIGNTNIIARADWHAPEPAWYNEVIYYNTAYAPLASILTNIVIHHTHNTNSVLENEKRHKYRGYVALGYHFFIDADGSIYEGRPIEIMGSHAGIGKQNGVLNDPDWGSIGIALKGDFHDEDNWFKHNTPSAQQSRSLAELVAALKCKYQIKQLLMHREVHPTACPGDQLVPIISIIRKKLGMKGADNAH